MKSPETLEHILRFGIVPIIRSSDQGKTAAAAEALVNAGLGVLEISLSHSGGLQILESLADRFGDTLLLGAGTILDANAARAAVSAGARFIVSPSSDASVIDAGKKLSVAVIPGALTPTEIVVAWKSGADAIKVFPANAMGGPSYIRALRAPLPGIVMLPCGGVNAENAADYFDAGASALLLGSSLVDMTLPETELAGSVREKAALLMSIAAAAGKARP